MPSEDITLKIKADARAANQATTGFTRNVVKLAAGFASAGAAVALLNKGYKSLVAFGKESLNLSNIQREAENNLAAALRASGQEVTNNVAEMKKLASEMQKVSIFGDEVTLNMQAFLVTAGLTAEQLKRATPLVLDFAQATGADLQTAAKLVGLTLNGNISTLRRYGITITDAAAQSKDFNRIADDLATRIGGRAVAATQTLKGSFQQLKNAIGDAQELLGSAVTDSGSLLWSVQKLTEVFSDTEAAQKLLTDEFGNTIDLAQPVIRTMISVAEAVASLADAYRDARVFNDAFAIGLEKLNVLNLKAKIAITGPFGTKRAELQERLTQEQAILKEMEAQGQAEANRVANMGRLVDGVKRFRAEFEAANAERARNASKAKDKGGAGGGAILPFPTGKDAEKIGEVTGEIVAEGFMAGFGPAMQRAYDEWAADQSRGAMAMRELGKMILTGFGEGAREAAVTEAKRMSDELQAIAELDRETAQTALEEQNKSVLKLADSYGTLFDAIRNGESVFDVLLKNLEKAALQAVALSAAQATGSGSGLGRFVGQAAGFLTGGFNPFIRGGGGSSAGAGGALTNATIGGSRRMASQTITHGGVITVKNEDGSLVTDVKVMRRVAQSVVSEEMARGGSIYGMVQGATV